MTKSKRSVGVIGLGPAGLATVKELKNSGGFGVVMGFDRCSRVGGRWSLDRDTHDAGIWKELCANVTRRHMEFSDFPWNDDNAKDEDEDEDVYEYEGRELAYAGIYPHCTEARAYLESYARKFNLYPHLRLETEVTSIEKVDSGGWKILTTTTSNKRKDKHQHNSTTVCHEFDAIVVCSGPQAKAYHPLKSKLKDFTGSVIHSQQFQSEKDYKDQRVLVIGGNVSGSEIVSVLAEDEDDSTTETTTATAKGTTTSCQKVVHSVRKMPYHVQKFTKDRTSYDDTIFNRMSVWLDRILPDSVLAKGFQMTILHYWPEQYTSTSTSASNSTTTTTNAATSRMPNCSVGVSTDIRNCGVTVTKNYVEQVTKGHFDVKPEVGTVNGKRITFVDGTTEEFDVIICATGYDFDLSFLPESVQEQVRVVHPSTGKTLLALYKNTLVVPPTTAEDMAGGLVDSLAFCGLINSVGPYFPQAEMQARYIAAVWSGKIPRPGLSALGQNAEAAIQKRLDTSSILNNFDTATIVNESLGEELGITPTVVTAVCNPKKYLLGPIYACFYRTNGHAPDGDEVVAKRCRERFDRLIASSPQVRQQQQQVAAMG